MSIVPPEATGPEYEALRRLPEAEQKRLWRRSYFRWLRKPITWSLLWGLGCFAGMGVMVGMASAKIMGTPFLFQMFAGIMGAGAGGTAGGYIMSRLLTEALRPFIREELRRHELAENGQAGHVRE
jgi:hypothetical protein